jgi:hypothetical protein
MNTANIHTEYISVTVSKRMFFTGAGILLLLAGALLAGHVVANIPVALFAR